MLDRPPSRHRENTLWPPSFLDEIFSERVKDMEYLRSGDLNHVCGRDQKEYFPPTLYIPAYQPHLATSFPTSMPSLLPVSTWGVNTGIPDHPPGFVQWWLLHLPPSPLLQSGPHFTKAFLAPAACFHGPLCCCSALALITVFWIYLTLGCLRAGTGAYLRYTKAQSMLAQAKELRCDNSKHIPSTMMVH